MTFLPQTNVRETVKESIRETLPHLKTEASVTQNVSLPQCPSFQFPQEIITELIDGILIVTEEGELIYANEGGRRVLESLNSDRSHRLPHEIWHICQSLIRSRSLFPSQHWLIGSEILTDSAMTLHVRARWLNLDTIEQNCLLLTVEDQYQAIKNLAFEEAQKYGLTPREREIWLLHRSNSTYKEIATTLNITPNTVKKHMRSIHAKQKSLEDFDD